MAAGLRDGRGDIKLDTSQSTELQDEWALIGSPVRAVLFVLRGSSVSPSQRAQVPVSPWS